MLIKSFSMKRFWKLAALIVVAAVPLILLAKKRGDEKGLVPESGDEPDLYGQEL
jgi:hypothetical protein